MKSEVSVIYWKTLEMDGEKSCIGGPQIFSDKYQLSLSTRAIVFYPRHITCINFMEDVRRNYISSGKKVAAYLPARFEDVHDCYETF